MAKVITFSQEFPSYHYNKGLATFFVPKILKSISGEEWLKYYWFNVGNKYFGSLNLMERAYSEFEPKHHTIRVGKRWKEGDIFSPRIWSGKPYNSTQFQFAPDIKIIKTIDFKIENGLPYLNNEKVNYDLLCTIATNDGLNASELKQWFHKDFEGQVIIWNEKGLY